MHRVFRSLLVAGFLLAGLSPALAAADDDAVVVVDVRGPLEQRALDFIVDAIENEPGQVIVLQIDNPGIASGDPTELHAAIDESPRPVVAWVGPAGAQAFGGAGSFVLRVHHSGAAPGAEVGYLQPPVAGDEVVVGPVSQLGLDDARVVVFEPIDQVIDVVVPTIGQFIASLDEQTIETVAGAVTLNTAEPATDEDGNEIIVPAVDVRFLKPGLLTRFLRLAMRPEATFFFLTIGLAAAAFEFYAAGVGITAAVASLALFLAGFGLASLPIDWLSFALVLAGMALYTVDFQNTTISWRGLLGTGLLLYGGLTITNASPQFGPRWWSVVLIVIGIAAFYMVALTTVARSRFSTRTIGRQHLVGRRGVAETDFDPMGIVDVDGARWRARSHRAAGIVTGDPIEVTAVTGVMLEIGPVGGDPGSIRD